MNRKMIGKVALLGLMGLGLVFLSCAAAETPAPTSKAPAGAAPVQPQGWEQDWQKTLAAAKQEGPLVIYISGAADTRLQIGKAFKEKFGLEIEWTPAQSAQLPAKITQERRAGLFVPDFITGSTTAQLTLLKPEGMIDPIKPLLVLPEVLNKQAWFGGDITWVDNEKMYTMNNIFTPSYKVSLNTSMVKPEEIKSYNDLLDPRWKGKIVVMNPILSVRPFSEIAFVMGVDWWRKLVANEPVVVDVDRLGAEWVARGRYPLGIFSRVDVLEEFVKAGAPIGRAMPKEGSFVAGGGVATSLLNRAPHPNAARVYANWFLSKDGSTVLSRAVAGQSARLDVPTDHVDPALMRDPNVKYVPTETEEFFARMANDRARGGPADEIFGPLTGRK